MTLFSTSETVTFKYSYDVLLSSDVSSLATGYAFILSEVSSSAEEPIAYTSPPAAKK